MTKRANLQIALLSGLIALGGTTLVAQNADKAEGGKQSHFVQLDTDMNGEVTAEEMKAHAAARFAAADADGDGFLTQDELAAAAKARHAERSQRMLEKLDTDGNGSLSATELEAMGKGKGDRMAKRHDKMMKRMDAN